MCLRISVLGCGSKKRGCEFHANLNLEKEMCNYNGECWNNTNGKYIEIEVLCILVILEYMFKSSTLTRMNHPKNWVVGCYLHLFDKQNSPTFIYVIPVKTNTDQLPGCDFMSNTGIPDYCFMLPDQHSVIKSLWKHYDKKWMRLYMYTVQCRYNAVNFLENPHNRHPISRPWGRGMGCLLWF